MEVPIPDLFQRKGPLFFYIRVNRFHKPLFFGMPYTRTEKKRFRNEAPDRSFTFLVDVNYFYFIFHGIS